jgi:hypothetical protein
MVVSEPKASEWPRRGLRLFNEYPVETEVIRSRTMRRD